MGYYKNQLLEEMVEVGDRKRARRSTYVRPVGVIVISKKIMFATLTIVWAQFSVTAGLLVWVVTR
jgi:hypothetical protein